jgi:hypothetical protein
MRYQFIIVLSGLICLSCLTNNERETTISKSSSNSITTKLGNKMKIKIGSDIFKATIYENKTTEVFKSMLPLTLNMSELNNNEKYAQLSSDLPTNAENIKTIQKGDIMLWGNNTLVVFYKTFPTSYRYTKIGRIENLDNLVSALGNDDVTVMFELE